MRYKLLSDNDLDALRNALLGCREITMTRRLGEYTVTASTLPAPHPWRVAMLVQLRVKERGREWMQCFESVEAAGRELWREG